MAVKKGHEENHTQTQTRREDSPRPQGKAHAMYDPSIAMKRLFCFPVHTPLHPIVRKMLVFLAGGKINQISAGLSPSSYIYIVFV